MTVRLTTVENLLVHCDLCCLGQEVFVADRRVRILGKRRGLVCELFDELGIVGEEPLRGGILECLPDVRNELGFGIRLAIRVDLL